MSGTGVGNLAFGGPPIRSSTAASKDELSGLFTGTFNAKEPTTGRERERDMERERKKSILLTKQNRVGLCIFPRDACPSSSPPPPILPPTKKGGASLCLWDGVGGKMEISLGILFL